MKVLITGAAGFIGSHFCDLATRREGWQVHAVDKLTYAASLDNLAESFKRGLTFHWADIASYSLMERIFKDHGPFEYIVNFAAESHVDRSILDPNAFFTSNIIGTTTLLDLARHFQPSRFLQVSTDEVYGDIPEPDEASEEFPLRPSSPYAASKASADCMALAYHRTYGVPVIITRSSNNYGPRQYPEKLVPVLIKRALAGEPLPLYAAGNQQREWLHVEDNAHAILGALVKGDAGEIYNIGSTRRMTNRDVASIIITLTESKSTIISVQDRPGHDLRYAISDQKLRTQMLAMNVHQFETGMRHTIAWYKTHPGRLFTWDEKAQKIV